MFGRDTAVLVKNVRIEADPPKKSQILLGWGQRFANSQIVVSYVHKGGGTSLR